MSVQSAKIPPFRTEPLEFETAEELKRFSDAYAQACSDYVWEDKEKALQVFVRLDEEWPHNPAILGWLGVLHRHFENLREAIVYTEETVRLSPKSERASTSVFLLCNHIAWNYDDSWFAQRALEEAKRFLKLTGKPSADYGFMLVEFGYTPSDMEGLLPEEDYHIQLQNVRNYEANLEQPGLTPPERREQDKKFQE